MRQTIGILSWLMLAATCAYADLMWYYGDTSVEILQNQTGQSSGSAGRQVDWQDATLRAYEPNAPDTFGTGYLAIQQNRTTPPTYNHALFSFDDIFGSDIGQIGETNAFVINSATLWLYADSQQESFTMTLAGLAVQNAGWSENTATFNTIDGVNAWSGGTFLESLHGNYGSYTTVVQASSSWIGIDITLALKAYQSHLIGGVALIAPSEVTAAIRNMYVAANDCEQTDFRPGVYVNYSAVPEPGTTALLAWGGILCWMTSRRRKSVAVAVALSCSGMAQAAQTAWIGNGHSSDAPQADTADREMSTDWKEAQVNPDVTANTPCGVRDEIGVISPRTIPPLQSVVLLSFNELFTPQSGALPRSIVLDQSFLWIYVTQAVGAQNVALCGLHPDDRDWSETLASAMNKNGNSWIGGTVDSALPYEYGRFPSPEKTGWFQIPVDLSTALADYRAGRIGGLALVSLAEVGTRLCNFYFVSGKSSLTARHPALFVQYHTQSEAPGIENKWFRINDESGTVELGLYAPESDSVFMDGQSARYAFGGIWSLNIPAPSTVGTSTINIRLQGEAATGMQTFTQTTRPEPLDYALDGASLHLSWNSAFDQWYHPQETDNLLNPAWSTSGGISLKAGNGSRQTCTVTPAADRNYYRVLSHHFAWDNSCE